MTEDKLVEVINSLEGIKKMLDNIEDLVKEYIKDKDIGHNKPRSKFTYFK